MLIRVDSVAGDLPAAGSRPVRSRRPTSGISEGRPGHSRQRRLFFSLRPSGVRRPVSGRCASPIDASSTMSLIPRRKPHTPAHTPACYVRWATAGSSLRASLAASAMPAANLLSLELMGYPAPRISPAPVSSPGCGVGPTPMAPYLTTPGTLPALCTTTVRGWDCTATAEPRLAAPKLAKRLAGTW